MCELGEGEEGIVGKGNHPLRPTMVLLIKG